MGGHGLGEGLEFGVLVDGGLAENLPIDVARSLGVDVLIVVDVGFPLLPRQRLDRVTQPPRVVVGMTNAISVAVKALWSGTDKASSDTK